MNTGEPWPGLDEALPRVLRMQAKLHLWAARDAGRRFDDLYNLVCDPAFLVVAWDRVRKNKGARTAQCHVDERFRGWPGVPLAGYGA